MFLWGKLFIACACFPSHVRLGATPEFSEPVPIAATWDVVDTLTAPGDDPAAELVDANGFSLGMDGALVRRAGDVPPTNIK